MTVPATLAGIGLAGLLTGPAPMILDGITFSGHEVPASIRIGGRQAVILHRLPGGGRLFDIMGPDEDGIAWDGLLVGPGAARKASLLAAMRRAGEVRSLSFADFVLNIVIVHFEFGYQAQGAILPYRLRAEIIPDDQDPDSVGDTMRSGLPSSDLALVSDLLNAGIMAAGTYASLTVPSAQLEIATLSGQLGNASASLAAASAGSMSGTVENASQSVKHCMAIAGNATVGDLDRLVSPGDAMMTLAASGIVATAARARAHLARAQKALI